MYKYHIHRKNGEPDKNSTNNDIEKSFAPHTSPHLGCVDIQYLESFWPIFPPLPALSLRESGLRPVCAANRSGQLLLVCPLVLAHGSRAKTCRHTSSSLPLGFGQGFARNLELAKNRLKNLSIYCMSTHPKAKQIGECDMNKELKEFLNQISKGNVNVLGDIYDIMAAKIYNYIFLITKKRQMSEDIIPTCNQNFSNCANA